MSTARRRAATIPAVSNVLDVQRPVAILRRLPRAVANTPGRLRLLMVLAIGGCGLLWLLGAATVGGMRQSATALSTRTVPTAIDALQVHQLLTDADRLAASGFLAHAADDSTWWRQYDADIATATQQLEQLAEANGPGGPVTRPLQEIGGTVTLYSELVQAARGAARQSYSIAVAYFWQATELMHRPGSGILARVDTLPTAATGGGGPGQWLLVAGIALAFAVLVGELVLLVGLQVFLRRRFRRRWSPPLLGAVAVLLVLGAWGAAEAATTQHGLESAQQGAFPRLHLLWQTRAMIDDANEFDSLSLLLRGEGVSYDDQFHQATNRLVDRPLTDQLVSAAAGGDVRFGGLLGDQLRSAPSREERAAELGLLSSYREFLDADARARALVGDGDTQGAAALMIGTGQGQMGNALAALQTDLVARSIVEQTRFDAAATEAQPSLALDAGIAAGAIAMAVLIRLAVRPRLAEYTA
jgi:hypothetical protein